MQKKCQKVLLIQKNVVTLQLFLNTSTTIKKNRTLQYGNRALFIGP